MPVFRSKYKTHPIARVELTKILKLKKAHRKRAVIYNQIAFLRRCRQEGLIPHGFRIKQKIHTDKIQRETKRLEHCYVNEQINVLFQKKKNTQDFIERTTTWLVWRIHPTIWIDIREEIISAEQFTFYKTRTIHMRKIEKLAGNKTKDNNPGVTEDFKTIGESVLVNLSDKILSEDQERGLSYGLKQIVTNNKINKLEVAIDTELNMQRNKLEDNTIPLMVNKLINDTGSNKINITKAELKGLRELKEDNDIIVLRADKGYKTVIMNAVDYDRKLKDVVYSPEYTELEHSPTSMLDSRVRKILGKVNKKQKTELNLFNRIYTHHTREPSIFGQPKIHKDGAPLRPIISSFNTVLSNAAKFITPILNQIYVNQKGPHYELLNIYEAKSKLRAGDEEGDYIMFSLDVINMFGNIQGNVAFNIISNLVKQDKTFKAYSEIPVSIFLDLLKLILENSYFKYDNKYFKQIQGLPMGSSTSAVVAKIVMQELENKFMNVTNFSKIKYIGRYMDDYVGKWFGEEETLHKFVEDINELDEHIKFTIEIEKDNSIRFLDADIEHKGDNLKFRMSKKSYDANIVVPGNAFQDEAVKRTIIKGETLRTLRISDQPEEDLRLLETKFRKNYYKSNTINREMESTINKYKKEKEPNMGEEHKNRADEEKPKRFMYKYMGKTTRKLKKKFKKLGYQIVNKKQTSMENYFASKFKYKTDLEKGIIYKVLCSCGEIYIGQSSFDLNKRIAEHKRSLKRKETSNALAVHSMTTAHAIDWDKSVVLDREANPERRRLMESLYIQKYKPSINMNVGVKLKHEWENIFPNDSSKQKNK